MNKNYIFTSIIIGGVLISGSILYSTSIIYGFSIDTLQKIFSIIGSLSILVAVATYYVARERDMRNSITEQISFFRKEALSEGDAFLDFVRNKSGYENYNFPLSRVRLDNPTIEFANQNYHDQSSMQLKLLRELKTIGMQTKILNILEEFALRVFNSKTLNNDALNPLKHAYVELVEINAIVLLQLREFFVGKQSYLNTLKLYDLWKNDVDRRTPEERIKEFNNKFSKRT